MAGGSQDNEPGGRLPRGVPPTQDGASRLSDEERQEARGFTKLQIAALVIVFGVVVALGYLLYCRAVVPFEPYHAYSYSVKPTAVCPGGSVHTVVDRRLSSDVERTNYVSVWHAEDPEEPPWPGGDGVFIANTGSDEKGRHTFTSPIQRTAPDDPGVWILHTTLQVHGKVGPVARVQEIHLIAEDTPLTVLGDDDPECG